MSIVRDDRDEHQKRVDRMVEEFRKARSRRLAKAITVKGDDRRQWASVAIGWMDAMRVGSTAREIIRSIPDGNSETTSCSGR
jgi:hypothetical protein